jgi:ATP-dependent DNA ligase
MGIMLRMRALPAGFIAPCLPTKTDKLPSGSQWLHEIKHDGFRIVARKDGPNIEGDGPTVFAHACNLGLKGIVSKRLGSHYAPAGRRIGSR